jgi:di/tricarboxylate transporter
MASLAAVLSAIMNNVAALALLMPVDIQAAEKAKRSRALSLMPLSFASILGSMITLIGTPPNIVVAEYRNDALGAPLSMFDFAPVGIACAAVGVAFVALIGWRLLPADRSKTAAGKRLFDLADYIAELKVAEASSIIGKKVRELDADAEKNDVEIIGLIRKGKRMPGLARVVEIKAGDLLVVEANPENIESLLGAMGLEYVGTGVSMLRGGPPESDRGGGAGNVQAGRDVDRILADAVSLRCRFGRRFSRGPTISRSCTAVADQAR